MKIPESNQREPFDSGSFLSPNPTNHLAPFFAETNSTVKVNDESLRFYWSLGRDIATMHSESKYGSKFFDTLSLDLREEFPEQKGFSTTNIRYAQKWYLFYSQNDTILQQVVAESKMPIDFALVPTWYRF